MESKKLEALLMAVDLGSFTKAAEVLGYTQSGLTHMMNSLEKEVGFTLLERGRSGVRLTEEGERIAPAVREFLQANARLDSVIKQVASSRTEIIRVSAYASIAMHTGCRASSSASARSAPTWTWISAWLTTSTSPTSCSRRARWTPSSSPRRTRASTSGCISPTIPCLPFCRRISTRRA